MFKIPFQRNETLVYYFDKGSGHADLIHETLLIVCDETPIMNRLVFKAVDYHLNDICNNQNAF